MFMLRQLSTCIQKASIDWNPLFHWSLTLDGCHWVGISTNLDAFGVRAPCQARDKLLCTFLLMLPGDRVPLDFVTPDFVPEKFPKRIQRRILWSNWGSYDPTEDPTNACFLFITKPTSSNPPWRFHAADVLRFWAASSKRQRKIRSPTEWRAVGSLYNHIYIYNV